MNLSRGIRLWFFGIFFILFATQCTPLGLQTPSLKDRFKENSPEQILNWAEQENQRNPNEPEPYLVRAQAAFDLAKSKADIAARKAWYIEMRLAVDEFDQLSDQSGISVSERLLAERDTLVSKSWSHEFSQAKELIKQEEASREGASFGALQMALDLLENAYVIQPEATESTEWLATLIYENGDAIRALQLLEEGRLSESFRPEESEAYLEKLAWLYLETGNLNSAVDIYEELNRGNKATKRIRTAYINALLLNGEKEKAIVLLTTLSDDFPNDPDIKKSLLIESLRELKNVILSESSDTQLRDDLQSPLQKSQELIDRIASLVENSAIWWSPLPQTAQGGFGYQRLTSEESSTSTDVTSTSYLSEVGQLFIELLDELEQMERLFPQEFQIAAQELEFTLQNSALPVLERLYENQSESVDIAEALLDLYTELGMKQEADALQKRLP